MEAKVRWEDEWAQSRALVTRLTSSRSNAMRWDRRPISPWHSCSRGVAEGHALEIEVVAGVVPACRGWDETAGHRS